MPRFPRPKRAHRLMTPPTGSGGHGGGGGTGTPATTYPFGARGFDIRAKGALPGAGNATATRIAIQQAIDAAPEYNTPHNVVIPSGDWFVDRPLMIDRWINLIGEPGGGSVLYGLGETTPVLIGTSRQGYNRTQALTATHLDGASGTQFKGLYLDGGEHAYIWVSPLSHGQFPTANAGIVDAYSITDQFTVEWQQDLKLAPLLTGPVFGLSTSHGPSPWCITFTPAGGNWNGTPGTAGALRVIYAINDGSKYGHALNASFTLPGGLTGKVDFAVTVSPKQGTVAAWVNGIRLAPIGGYTDAFPTSGSKFQPNPGVGFQFACDTEQFQGPNGGFITGNAPAGTLNSGMNRNFTGFRFWTAAPYALNGATGSAQARTDATPIDPAGANSRYFTQEPGVAAWIPFTDTPASVIANRQFTVNFGNGVNSYPSVAGFIVNNDGVDFDWQHGSIQNLTLISNGGSFAPAFGMGWINDYTIRDCSFIGGMLGCAQIPTAAAYTLRMDGFNTVAATDVGMVLYDADVLQTGKLEFNNYGRSCLTSLGTSSLKFQYIYVAAASPQSDYLIHAANLLEIDRLAVDIEFNNAILKAFVRVDALSGVPTGINCMIGSFFTGNIAPNVSMIFLDATDSDQFGGVVSVANVSTYANLFRAVIETNGKSPRGQIEVTQDLLAPWVLNSTPDGLGSIVAIHRPETFLRQGTFATHGNVIRPRHPVDGQFSEWRVAQGGSYGMGAPGSPPRLVPMAPVDDSGAGLATYVQANYSATSGNAVAGIGPINSIVGSQFLDGYFGMGNLVLGTLYGSTLGAGLPAAPASVQAALIVSPGEPVDWYVLNNEATGGSYARVTTAFGASSAGIISNSSTITFPTLTAPIGTVTGIAILDPLTGTPIAQAPVDPIVTTTGRVISFAPGSVSIRSIPVPVGGSLAPQMGYIGAPTRDAFNNFYLRGVVYTRPTGLQFALSTAPASLAAPTEPVGNGYARVNAPAFTTAYLPAPYVMPSGVIAAATSNSAAVTFPAPTGSWGTIKSIYLLDGSGTVICAGNATIPRTVGSGSAVPVIAKGGFWVSW